MKESAPQRAYSNSVRIIFLNREKNLAELHQIATRIKQIHPDVIEIRLFGSLARGDNTGMSDIDVLILLEHTTESDPHKRIMKYLPYFELDRGVDLLVYTRAELNSRLTAGDHFLRRVWSESVIL
jgi:predicted nucleotidyltransferase